MIAEVLSGVAAAVSVFAAYKSGKAAKSADGFSVTASEKSLEMARRITDTLAKMEEASEVDSKLIHDSLNNILDLSSAARLAANEAAKHVDSAKALSLAAKEHAVNAEFYAGAADVSATTAKDHAAISEASADLTSDHLEEVKLTAKNHQIRVQAAARCSKCGFRVVKYSVTGDGIVTCASCDNEGYKRSLGA